MPSSVLGLLPNYSASSRALIDFHPWRFSRWTKYARSTVSELWRLSRYASFRAGQLAPEAFMIGPQRASSSRHSSLRSAIHHIWVMRGHGSALLRVTEYTLRSFALLPRDSFFSFSFFPSPFSSIDPPRTGRSWDLPRDIYFIVYVIRMPSRSGTGEWARRASKIVNDKR